MHIITFFLRGAYHHVINISIKGLYLIADINECEHPESYPCYGECHNKDGGFDCFCRDGTRGNATIPGGCQKNFLTRKARVAIGTYLLQYRVASYYDMLDQV